MLASERRASTTQSTNFFPASDLGSPRAHLIINDELPTFQGSGGNEFLCTLNLRRLGGEVGVVSMVHRRADLAGIAELEQANVRFFLWQSPHLDAAHATLQSTRATLRRWHARMFRAWLASTNWCGRPLDVVMFGGQLRNMAGPLLAALTARHWPVVSVVQTHAGDIIDLIPRPAIRVLVMHDIRALLYERRTAVETSPWRRWSLRREASRYRRHERSLCQRFDLVVTMSPEDAGWVEREYEPRRVAVRHLPVNADFFAPLDSRHEIAGRIVFTGLMNHPPNIDAACFMARDVLPRIRVHDVTVEFWIVGRNPGPEVRALGELPGVHVTGEVADVRPHLAAAPVVIVPLRYGSGARNKIVEAWSLGKCVVSTTVGAEGLEHAHGKNILIADGAEALASTTLEALRNSELRDQVRLGGRGVVLRTHVPANIAEVYAREIEEISDAKAALATPMSIAIDMRWMTPGLAGGIEQLARAFLRELLSIDRHNAYTLIVPARIVHGIDLRRHPNFQTTSLDGAIDYIRRAWRVFRRQWYRAVRFDDWFSDKVQALEWLRSLNAEMVYAFPGYTHPDVHALPQVLMVPDIQHEYWPQFFTPQALEERTRLYRDSIQRATHLCAISEFTRQTLIEKLGVEREKVTTIHLAADPAFQQQSDETDAAVLRRHSLVAGKYLFFPGHTWHHKNHQTAVQAVGRLHKTHSIQYPLICTGGIREAQQAIEQEVGKQGLHGMVRFVGYCPQEHLPALYRNAACLLFPSLFEGFGMPVLEAMACGCPVVCSNTSSLPEIAGDAALLVDPQDPDALAVAVADVVSSRELQERMRERGLNRARQFSWRRHTVETLRVLYQVHERLRTRAPTAQVPKLRPISDTPSDRVSASLQ